MIDKFTIGDRDVLLIVDIQNDFCPGGSLSVPRGHEVAPLINGLAARFAHVVLTQDWHPRGHLSFASSHPGKKPYQTIALASNATSDGCFSPASRSIAACVIRRKTRTARGLKQS